MLCELEVNDIGTYVELITRIDAEQQYRMWFRGQSDYSWGLVPSVQRNDNRLSLYSAQMGKCAVTGAKLMIGDIFCHHKVPRCNGGTDAYQNLILLCGNAHRLIHATDTDTIARLTDSLNLTPKQKTKVDKLRSLVHVESC